LYRILTPSGSNFLDFSSVVINAPTVRTVLFENLTHAELVLELSASQPEDVELFVKSDDVAKIVKSTIQGKYSGPVHSLERVSSPATGELKERFMETLRHLSAKDTGQAKVKDDDKLKRSGSATRKAEKDSVAASVGAALRRGGRGRPVHVSVENKACGHCCR